MTVLAEEVFETLKVANILKRSKLKTFLIFKKRVRDRLCFLK